jgi:hypothetical protein
MGMYINETTVMCVTPHVQGRPEDYGRETVQVTVAMNGQDFNENDSDAYITFVGTGSGGGQLKILIFILLLALLALAIVFLATFTAGGAQVQAPPAFVHNDTNQQLRGTFGHVKNFNPEQARLSQQRRSVQDGRFSRGARQWASAASVSLPVRWFLYFARLLLFVSQWNVNSTHT